MPAWPVPVSSVLPNWVPHEPMRVDCPSRSEVICHHCKKPGHIKSACLVLRKREVSKSMAFANVQGKEQEQAEPVASVDALAPPGYEGFVSKGSVSTSEDSEKVPIIVLRDSGACQSLLLEGVVDLPPLF